MSKALSRTTRHNEALKEVFVCMKQQEGRSDTMAIQAYASKFTGDAVVVDTLNAIKLGLLASDHKN